MNREREILEEAIHEYLKHVPNLPPTAIKPLVFCIRAANVFIIERREGE